MDEDYTNIENQISLETSLGTKIAYSHGTLIDTMSSMNFVFLGFTFYFAVVGLPVYYIFLGSLIYTFWDAFNDPLLGAISDRTKSRYGRRKLWLYITAIPMVILTLLLWTPPLTAPLVIKFFYFLIIIILYDAIYTIFTVNINALWPEMFLTIEERTKIGWWRNIFMIIALSIAYLLPGIIIKDMANRYNLPETPQQYFLMGVILSVIVLISYIILFKWGVFEREEFARDVEKAPSLKDSLNITLRNKAFVIYCIVLLCIFCVYGMLPSMMPLYGTFVLGLAKENSFLISLLLFIGLILGALFTPFWMWLQKKLGVRKCFMISIGYWALAVLLFITATEIFTAFLYMIIMGPAVGGVLYFYDQGMAEIIDDDSVRSGCDARREGAYYGVSALFNRFAGIFNMLVISIVFTGAGWSQYNPNPGVDVIFGLKFLVGIWPMITLSIAFLCLFFWPIHGKRLEEDKRLLEEQRIKKQREAFASN